MRSVEAWMGCGYVGMDRYGCVDGRLPGEWRGSETEAFLSAGQRPVRTRSEPPDSSSFHAGHAETKKKAIYQQPTA